MCKLKYLIFIFVINSVSSRRSFKYLYKKQNKFFSTVNFLEKSCKTPNGLSGVCVPPSQCNHLFKISSSYGIPIPPHIRAYLVKFLCPDQVSNFDSFK